MLKRTSFKPRAAQAPTASQVNLFAVPVLVFDWPEATYWQNEIKDAIAQRRRRARSVQAAYIDGAWRSRADLPSWPESGVQALVRWAAAMASRATAGWRHDEDAAAPTRWRMDGTATLIPPGGAQLHGHRHVHQPWNWSATYFAHIPYQDSDTHPRGDLIFEDRAIGIDTAEDARAGRRSFAHQPHAGELVIHPSWLFQRMDAHFGEGDAMSVAFNFYSEWLEPSRAWRGASGKRWRGAGDVTPPDGYDINPEPTYL